MDAPLLDAVSVATYLEAVEWLEGLVARPDVARAWTLPSALAHYTTGGLAAHAVYAGVLRTVQLLGETEPISTAPVTTAQYYGPNRLDGPDADDPLFAVLREGAEKVARRGPQELVATCAAAGRELGASLPGQRADRAVPVARVSGGTALLADYLTTRIFEIVVHGDDLVASVPGAACEPPGRALDVCLSLCLELARARIGDVAVLRAFTRAERSQPEALRVL